MKQVDFDQQMAQEKVSWNISLNKEGQIKFARDIQKIRHNGAVVSLLVYQSWPGIWGLVSASYDVVSLDKKHCSTLPISAQVHHQETVKKF